MPLSWITLGSTAKVTLHKAQRDGWHSPRGVWERQRQCVRALTGLVAAPRRSCLGSDPSLQRRAGKRPTVERDHRQAQRGAGVCLVARYPSQQILLLSPTGAFVHGAMLLPLHPRLLFHSTPHTCMRAGRPLCVHGL